jgi:hypothetical protein
MFKIDSNLEEVKKTLTTKLENAIQFDKVLREVCLDAIVLISHRVQQDGKKSDGSKITTTSKKRFGAYSYQYGKKRASKGLQTKIIDQTFTGDMLGDFTLAPEGEKSYVIGFRGKTASDKAEWNERRFGKIYQLSKDESKLIQDIIRKRINAILNK